MKKYVSLLAATAMLCVLFAVSCTHDSGNEEHTNTDFLEGRWTSESGAYTFTIATDLSFECLLKKTGIIYAKIKGDLAYADSALGPDDYILSNLVKLQTMEDSTHTLNAGIETALGGMNGTVISIKPNANKNRFTFMSTGSAQSQLAQDFFGNDGDFVKQQ